MSDEKMTEVNKFDINDDDGSLVGMFFHRKRGGKISEQGAIKWVGSNNIVALEFFSWLDGRPTTLEFVSIKDMMQGDYVFYVDQGIFTAAGEESMK